jgi:hypothetical protein
MIWIGIHKGQEMDWQGKVTIFTVTPIVRGSNVLWRSLFSLSVFLSLPNNILLIYYNVACLFLNWSHVLCFFNVDPLSSLNCGYDGGWIELNTSCIYPRWGRLWKSFCLVGIAELPFLVLCKMFSYFGLKNFPLFDLMTTRQCVSVHDWSCGSWIWNSKDPTQWTGPLKKERHLHAPFVMTSLSYFPEYRIGAASEHSKNWTMLWTTCWVMLYYNFYWSQLPARDYTKFWNHNSGRSSCRISSVLLCDTAKAKTFLLGPLVHLIRIWNCLITQFCAIKSKPEQTFNLIVLKWKLLKVCHYGSLVCRKVSSEFLAVQDTDYIFEPWASSLPSFANTNSWFLTRSHQNISSKFSIQGSIWITEIYSPIPTLLQVTVTRQGKQSTELMFAKVFHAIWWNWFYSLKVIGVRLIPTRFLLVVKPSIHIKFLPRRDSDIFLTHLHL